MLSKKYYVALAKYLAYADNEDRRISFLCHLLKHDNDRFDTKKFCIAVSKYKEEKLISDMGYHNCINDIIRGL